MTYPEQIGAKDLLRLRLEQFEGYAEVSLAGEIDFGTAAALEERLARVTGSIRTDDLVVNLRDVTFIDSTGLRIFIVLHQRLKGDGRRLVLRDPTAAAKRIIEISCGDDFLNVEDSA